MSPLTLTFNSVLVFSDPKPASARRRVKDDYVRTWRVTFRKLEYPISKRLSLVACGNEDEHSHQNPQWNDEHSDYFGRDPRKETEFWMEHAREVLGSKEVADAVEAHKKSGKGNLTEEQKAWLEFAKSISPPLEKNE